MYQPRAYRDRVNGDDLVSYTVKIKETDLLIRTCSDLSAVAWEIVVRHREALEKYISQNPFFAASFDPVEISPDAPAIVKMMAASARISGVGPMAAVAGAFSELVGEELARFSSEVIVENGGDNYLRSSQERIVSIYAGDSPLSGRVGLRIPPEKMPLGVCTSSATVGPSISLGKADAAVIAAPSTALADAAATAVGNSVISENDIPQALELARNIAGVIGVVIIKGDKIGVWGSLEICRTS